MKDRNEEKQTEIKKESSTLRDKEKIKTVRNKERQTEIKKQRNKDRKTMRK